MDPILHVPYGWNTATFGAQRRRRPAPQSTSTAASSLLERAPAAPKSAASVISPSKRTPISWWAQRQPAPALSASAAEAVAAATCVKGATPLRRLADNSGLPTAKRPAPIGEDSAAGIARGARRRIGRRQQAERMWTPGRTPTDGAVRAGGRCDD